MMRVLVLLSFAFGLLGCATTARQTDALLSAQPNIAPTHEIENVPFIDQEDHFCGPSTLAMALAWSKKEVNLEDLSRQVYTPGMKGTLQLDMITASRRNGMMAIPISGLPALLKEVEAGHPVIVFENLLFSWYPQYHYALVFGYDLKNEEVILHSGHDAFKHWDMRRFERSWMLGDYWGLVVLPPTELAASADELTHATAAAGLEQAGKLDEAGVAYGVILKKWPQSLLALIGSANLAFAKNDFRSSIKHLREATMFHPESSIAWHNLAVALGTAHKNQAARKSAIHALSLASAEDHDLYQKSLEKYLQ